MGSSLPGICREDRRRTGGYVADKADNVHQFSGRHCHSGDASVHASLAPDTAVAAAERSAGVCSAPAIHWRSSLDDCFQLAAAAEPAAEPVARLPAETKLLAGFLHSPDIYRDSVISESLLPPRNRERSAVVACNGCGGGGGVAAAVAVAATAGDAPFCSGTRGAPVGNSQLFATDLL